MIFKYFMDYKLKDVGDKDYKRNFINYLCISSQLPNMILNTVNLFVIIKGAGLVRQIFGSLIVVLIICGFTIGMIFFPSNECKFYFFNKKLLKIKVFNIY